MGAKAKNKVIAGDYESYGVIDGFDNKKKESKAEIILSFKNCVEIDKDTVESYEIITEEKRKSASSGIARGAIGMTLLGPVGLLAAMSAKQKGIYTIALKFKDGKNSLIEVDEKIYKRILKTLF